MRLTPICFSAWQARCLATRCRHWSNTYSGASHELRSCLPLWCCSAKIFTSKQRHFWLKRWTKLDLDVSGWVSSKIWCWGWNSFVQLGLSQRRPASRKTAVTVRSKKHFSFSSLAARAQSCVLQLQQQQSSTNQTRSHARIEIWLITGWIYLLEASSLENQRLEALDHQTTFPLQLRRVLS